jgi:hypothetical protein
MPKKETITQPSKSALKDASKLLQKSTRLAEGLWQINQSRNVKALSGNRTPHDDCL